MNGPPDTGLPVVEVGWLQLHDPDPIRGEAIRRARERTLETLCKAFPGFTWRMPEVRRNEPIAGSVEEVVVQLDAGLEELDAHGWDFCLVVVPSDLRPHYGSRAWAAVSRALGVGVLSTARLLPDEPLDDARSAGVLAARLSHVALHLLGDLNGIGHADDPASFLSAPRDVADLDAMERFGPAEREALGDALEEVADLRVEEEGRRSGPGFLLRALWVGRRDVASAVFQARPWEFPLRLGRLTAAAVSSCLLLLLTAEVWDLGMNQPLARMGVFSVVALLGTSAFTLSRQRLLLSPRRRRRSEQSVVANTAIRLVVLAGMTTTWVLLFGLALALGFGVYPSALVRTWAASLPEPPGVTQHLALAQLVAGLGILIGALGASFEGRHYFRHITYVDEEL